MMLSKKRDRSAISSSHEDLPSGIVIIDESELADFNSKDPSHSLTKKEKKAKRIQDNKEWKTKVRTSWSDDDPNPRHTQYYIAQFPDIHTEEWGAFRQCLSIELPVTFRIGHVASSSMSLQSLLGNSVQNLKRSKGRFIQVKDVVLSNSDIITDVNWLDNTWQLAADATSLSKETSLSFLKDILHDFVTSGLIIRQELVSMIPAALLDVKHWHTIIDMCAAPGSKTSQLLQIMTDQCCCQPDGIAHSSSSSIGSFPTGVVIANDADSKRIETLRNRFAHAEHPSLIITCSRAEDLVRRLIDSNISVDRIICDVPCSGDGTFRKSPHLWRLFRPRSALELHPLQLQLAISGFTVLRPGGRMVYSTCSLNPIEDEAVVLGLLRYFKSGIRIVDIRNGGDSDKQGIGISKLLPLLKSRHGLSTWQCSSDVFSVGEEDESGRKKSVSKLPPILASMQPPSEEERDVFNLDHCLRIMPHDQNTGGFFIAVLEKLTEEDSNQDCDDANIGRSSIAGGGGKNSDKFVDIINNNQAMEVMKKLGYNPKKSHNLAPTSNLSQNGGQSSPNTSFTGNLETYFDFFDRSELCPSVQSIDDDNNSITSTAAQKDKGRDKDIISNLHSGKMNPNLKKLHMLESFNLSSKQSSDGDANKSSFSSSSTGQLLEVRAVSQGVRDLLAKDSLEGLKDPRVGVLVGSVFQSSSNSSDSKSCSNSNSNSKSRNNSSNNLGECKVVNFCADNCVFLSSLIKPSRIVKVDLQLFRTLLSVINNSTSHTHTINVRRAQLKSSLIGETFPDSQEVASIDFPDQVFEELLAKLGKKHLFIGVKSSSEMATSSSALFDLYHNSNDNDDGGGQRRRLSKAEKKKLKREQSHESENFGKHSDSYSNSIKLSTSSSLSSSLSVNEAVNYESVVLAFEMIPSADARYNKNNYIGDSSSNMMTTASASCSVIVGDKEGIELQIKLISNMETCRSFQQLLRL